MKVEITVPEQYYGDVLGDVARRRGQMTGETQRGNAKVIDAEVPLSEMFGYVTDLRSFTQGRGNYSMTFSHYGECPRYVAEEVIKKKRNEYSLITRLIISINIVNIDLFIILL